MIILFIILMALMVFGACLMGLIEILFTPPCLVAICVIAGAIIGVKIYNKKHGKKGSNVKKL